MKVPTKSISICLYQPSELYLNRIAGFIRVQQHAHNSHIKTHFDYGSSVITMRWTIVLSHCWWRC